MGAREGGGWGSLWWCPCRRARIPMAGVAGVIHLRRVRRGAPFLVFFSWYILGGYLGPDVI